MLLVSELFHNAAADERSTLVVELRGMTWSGHVSAAFGIFASFALFPFVVTHSSFLFSRPNGLNS